jgi:dolichol kinase
MISPGVTRRSELPRKALHLTTAIIPIGLGIGVPQRPIAVGLMVLFGTACVVELARRRVPSVSRAFDNTVGGMLRAHESRGRGITGATWLLAAFAGVTLAAPLTVAIAATWAGAVGDATAALVGTWWGRRRGLSGKTWAGSLACAGATTLGAFWVARLPLGPAAIVGVLSAVAERPSVELDDNVRVTVVAALVTLLLTR